MKQPAFRAGAARPVARLLTLTLLVAALVAVGFAGCTLSTEGTKKQECSAAADCPAASSECVDVVCDSDGFCGESPILEGDPPAPIVPTQVAGDCLRRVCTDEGALVDEPEDGDVPDNLLCEITYTCSGGELSEQAATAGDPCFDGGVEGVCVTDGGGLRCEFDCDANNPCPVSDNPCLVRTCNNVTSKCEDEELDNVPSPGDLDGDCRIAFCVAGVEDVVIDNTDLPDSAICNTGICTTGVPGQDPLPGGNPCNGGGDLEICDGEGNCAECNDTATCEQLPDDTDCSIRECINHVCVYTNRANGHVVPNQVPGDCKNVVCDGNGGTQIVNNDNDEPVDGNACSSDVCNNGTPSNPPCCNGSNCPAGVCNASGQCVGCNAPIDCGNDTNCAFWTCESGGVCQLNNEPNGTLVTTAPSGDCLRRVCNGSGQEVMVPDNDPPGDPNECQFYTCNSGNTVLNNRSNGTDCANNSNFCDGDENCQGGSCSSPGDPCDGPDNDTDCQESCDEGANNCDGNDPNGSLCGNQSNTQCDDPNSCFNGSCANNNEPPGTPCNDGTYCNGADSCSGGTCSVNAGNPCDGSDNDADCSEMCREADDDCDGNDPNNDPCDNGNGSCQAGVCEKGSLGDPCGGDGECASGFCDDDVCCNANCNGACEACDIGGSVGTCTDFAAGTDPDGECTFPGDTGPSCNAGACVCGTDPAGAQTDSYTDPTGTVNCAAGEDCEVTCSGSNGCSDATINCPPNNSCNVTCTGNNSCANITVNCGTEGLCGIACNGGNGNSCGGSASIDCGQDTCATSCAGTHSLSVTSLSSSCAYNNSGC